MKKRKSRPARTDIAEQKSTGSRRLQRNMDNRFQRLVSHARWTSLRTADSARSVQPLCAYSGAFAQPKRYGCASSSGAGFSSLRAAQSDPRRQRRALWWQRRSRVIALERVVVALGIAVEFIRPAHPQDNGAHEQMHRIFKADAAAPPARTVAAQKSRIRAWIGSYNYERPHEALGQRVPAQMYWPSSRPMPEQ